MNRTVVLSDIEPAPLSIRHPLGVDLDLTISFRDLGNRAVDPTLLAPQMMLLPRSKGGTYGYAVETYDPVNGLGNVKVPGAALIDRSGYGLELYLTSGTPPKPTGLAAKGTLVTLPGAAYQQSGPFGMMSVPVVTGPPGPPGPPGVPGQDGVGLEGERGSQWTSGPGAPPTPPPVGTLTGDMYIDNTTGDVWQYNGIDWVGTAP